MTQVEQVEVKLLKYTFQFKRLRWRQEFAIKFPPKSTPQRIILAHALLEVSGIQPKTLDEAIKVMEAVPMAIVVRVFRIWKGTFPPARYFTSSQLYVAPEPLSYIKKLSDDMEKDESDHDRNIRSAESKFGSQQLKETRELEQKILAGAQRKEGGYRGAIIATNDGEDGI